MLTDGDIGKQDGVGTGGGNLLVEGIRALHHRHIRVHEQPNRQVRVAAAHIAHHGKRTGQCRAGVEAADVRVLDGRAVGYWIGERNPELKGIGSGVDKRLNDRLARRSIGIAEHDKGNERALGVREAVEELLIAVGCCHVMPPWHR